MLLDSAIGATGHADTQVTEHNTAIILGSGALPVYATPSMAALMEQAACNAISAFLPLGSTSVGTAIQVKHLTATPLGHHVQATANLLAVDGHRLTFQVAAYDEKEKIGEGTHERFVVQAERFMQKVNTKQPVK